MRTKVAMLLFMMGLLSGSGAAAQVSGPAAPVMVFFDWAKSTFDRDYNAALDEEVTTFREAPTSTLVVEGHSDRSGNAAANYASSRLRAEVVRDYLVAHGIPAQRVAVRAWGEKRPMIATADGVREPQNRRVDVRMVTGIDR